MNILYVYAHPNPASFNAELKSQAVSALKERDYDIILSDLYSMSFNPVASWDDFKQDTQQSQYFLAQQDAYQQNTLSDDIQLEIEKIKQADHMIFQFPLWWFSVPAILKGWFDRVLVKGFAYDAGKVFQDGLLKGKSASFIVTTQSPESAYQKEGLHGATVDHFLHSVHHTLKFVGVEIKTTFVVNGAYQLEENVKQKIFQDLKEYLNSM